MKRIASVLTIFLALFVAAAAFGLRAEAAGAVYDNAKVLSSADVQKLTAEIQRIEKKHNVRIGIVTQPSMQGRSIGQVANALLDQGYRGAPNGGIVLLVSVDPKKREYYMSTDNPMRAKITDDKGIKYIQEEMVPKLKENKYGEAFMAYTSAIEKELDYFAAEGEPFDPSAGFHPLAAIAALIIGLLGGYGVRETLISSMSNVTPAARASEYLKEGSFDLTDSDDRFLFMNVTRTQKSKNSGGSSARDENHGGGGGSF
ncbi:MAG: TPM domain-containing protein [Schwartzia succinivorans]|nr:TPM domain-containing protein [Schwartzia succinivorans]